MAAGRGEEVEEITWAEFEAIAHNPNRIYQQIVNLLSRIVEVMPEEVLQELRSPF